MADSVASKNTSSSVSCKFAKMVKRLSAILLLLLPGLAPAADVTIGVEFGLPYKPVSHIGSGFLNGMDAFSDPIGDFITPLKPQLIRDNRFWVNGNVNADLYHRMKSLVPVVQYQLADSWLSNPPNGKMPCEDLAGWYMHVKGVARDFKEAGVYPQWNVWGEPNDGGNWSINCPADDIQQLLYFLYAYYLAFHAIRSEIPDAQIGGPALADDGNWESRRLWLLALMGFCAAYGCEVNFLSWHEYIDNNVNLIADHLLEIRAFALHSDFAGLALSNIYIGEMVGHAATYSPGHAVIAFSNLERGFASGAGKACWPVPGPGECDDNSLDGLLKTPEFLPRSVWWAHYYYAQNSGDLVWTMTTDDTIQAVASRDDAVGMKRVLVGYSGFASANPTAKNVDLVLSDVGADGDRTVRVLRVPNSGDQTLLAPEVVSDGLRTIVGGSLHVMIDAFSPNAAYAIEILP